MSYGATMCEKCATTAICTSLDVTPKMAHCFLVYMIQFLLRRFQ